MAQTKEERIGEISVNNYGNKMTIIEYKSSKNIVVKFENGYKTTTTYQNFKNKNISNPYDKTIYNIGYLGEGNYKTKVNKEHTIQYQYWTGILRRCYDEKSLLEHPTYIGCTVCKEWLNFQIFSKWFDENYYEIENDRMAIDKDILSKNNKIYSPETCVFVPQRINTLFLKSDKSRGEYPIGVDFKEKKRKYQASCSIIRKGKKIKKYIGLYTTPKEAFNEGYKPFKEDYIKQIANDYKNIIPTNLYDAMYRWEVEIDD